MTNPIVDRWLQDELLASMHRTRYEGQEPRISEALYAEIMRLRMALSAARALTAKQARDEGLWFQAQYASEAYLQSALHKLHAAVEGDQ